MVNLLKLLEVSYPTKTAEFDQWFGKSQVVDSNGDPLQVYHGTATDIERFQHSPNGAGSRESKLGYWFTNDAVAAEQFSSFARRNPHAGENIVPVFLSIQHPWRPEHYMDIRNLIDRHTQFSGFGKKNGDGTPMRFVQDKVDYDGARNELLQQGYDGIILGNTMTDSPYTDKAIAQFVALKPSQIKSVLNKGTFSSASDHISEGDKRL